MAEENELQGAKKLSRRRFIKNLAKGVVVVTGLGVATTVIPPILWPQGGSPEDSLPPAIPRPEALPEDVLSEEELANAHGQNNSNRGCKTSFKKRNF